MTSRRSPGRSCRPAAPARRTGCCFGWLRGAPAAIIVPSAATRAELHRFAPWRAQRCRWSPRRRGAARPRPGPAGGPRGAAALRPVHRDDRTAQERACARDAFRAAALDGWQLVIAGGWGWVSARRAPRWKRLAAANRGPAARLRRGRGTRGALPRRGPSPIPRRTRVSGCRCSRRWRPACRSSRRMRLPCRTYRGGARIVALAGLRPRWPRLAELCNDGRARRAAPAAAAPGQRRSAGDEPRASPTRSLTAAARSAVGTGGTGRDGGNGRRMAESRGPPERSGALRRDLLHHVIHALRESIPVEAGGPAPAGVTHAVQLLRHGRDGMHLAGEGAWGRGAAAIPSRRARRSRAGHPH